MMSSSVKQFLFTWWCHGISGGTSDLQSKAHIFDFWLVAAA